MQTGDRYTAIPWSLLPDGLHVNPGWTLRHLPDGEASCAPAALRPHHPPSLRLTPKSPSLISQLDYPHLLDDMGMRLSCAEDTTQMCRTRGRGAHSQQTFPPGRANLAATSCVPLPLPPSSGSPFYFHAGTGRVSLRNDAQAASAIQRGFRDSRGKVRHVTRDTGSLGDAGVPVTMMLVCL